MADCQAELAAWVAAQALVVVRQAELVTAQTEEQAANMAYLNCMQQCSMSSPQEVTTTAVEEDPLCVRARDKASKIKSEAESLDFEDDLEIRYDKVVNLRSAIDQLAECLSDYLASKSLLTDLTS